ncbi:MAG: hypothetical protein P1V97_02145 [Planctomycetota bacterium]|nr:hypothetical protein [Planctomycetota bacterium]
MDRKGIPPRVYFICIGLLLTGTTAYVDQDIRSVFALRTMMHNDFKASKDLEEAQKLHANEGLKKLHASISEKSEAQNSFTKDLGQPKFRKRDSKKWTKYEAAYKEGWPVYKEAVDKHIQVCEEAQNLDPKNGIFMAMGAQAKFEKAIWPSVHYGLGRRPEEMTLWSKVKIRDEALLIEALDNLETSLTYPEYSFRVDEQMKARLTRLENTSGIEGLVNRATAMFTCHVPNLLDLRQMFNILALMSAEESPLKNADKLRALRVGRQFALRWGDNSTFLIELILARACLDIIDKAWLDFATAQGDVQLVRALSDEMSKLQENTDVGGLDYDSSRLGLLDYFSMPSGGWSAPGFDPNLGRKMDHSVYESLFLWFCLLAAFGLMFAAWFSSKFYKSEPGDMKARGWTFGDVLQVVLPSFVLAAVFLIVLMRFHPARDFGLRSGENFLGVTCQTLIIIGYAVASYQVLLRRWVLEKFSLPVYSSKRLRTALVSAVVGLYLATSWVGPFNTIALWPAFALLIFAIGAAWTGLGHRRLEKAERRAVNGYLSRVSLACLGLVTCILPVLILGVSMPHRSALVESYTQQQIPLWQGEAFFWGEGRLKKQFRETMDLAYSTPVTREEMDSLRKAKKKALANQRFGRKKNR